MGYRSQVYFFIVTPTRENHLYVLKTLMEYANDHERQEILNMLNISRVNGNEFLITFACGYFKWNDNDEVFINSIENKLDEDDIQYKFTILVMGEELNDIYFQARTELSNIYFKDDSDSLFDDSALMVPYRDFYVENPILADALEKAER